MKNHHTFWEHMKQCSKQFKKLSKGIVAAGFVAGALLAPWSAARAQEVYADFNSDEYRDLAVSTPCQNERVLNYSAYRGTVATMGAVQVIYSVSMYSLETNAYAPTLLHQRIPDSINEYESGGAVDDPGFLVVFSW